LHEQIERTVMKYRWLLEKEGISISLDAAPLLLTGNESLLDNVWENLLTNAIKYNKPGGEIRIRTESEKDHVSVIFEDTGIGIAEDDLLHVFERFYRADASRSTKGTGLGLAIVKETITLHQGDIRISSETGEGTCITVTLPISSCSKSSSWNTS
jgi:signal transduction histidine kinase